MCFLYDMGLVITFRAALGEILIAIISVFRVLF